MKRFVVQLHSMMATILLNRMHVDEAGRTLFLHRLGPPCPPRFCEYPFMELTTVLPNPSQHPSHISGGIWPIAISQWGWELGFRDALVQWLRSLSWQCEASTVTFLELALDFEPHSGRCLPFSPHSRLAVVNISLQEKARMLRFAMVT